MKLIKSSLEQISLSCPSSWKGSLEDGTEVIITFRCGKLELKSGNRILIKGDKDQFDISSYIELQDALKILAKEGVESE